jgi:hypothetical protein
VLRSFADLEGFLHHVHDALHPLDDVIGFGWVVINILPELGTTSKVAGASTEAVDEVIAASAPEVAVKKPKQTSTGLARMSAMLAGKTTPDRAAMLHIKFQISPTWCANCQGVRPRQIRKGATQDVVG